MSINYGIIRYICWLVAAFATSLLFTLVVETPSMILEKEFLMGGGKRKLKKKTSGDNIAINGNGHINGNGKVKDEDEAFMVSINADTTKDSFVEGYSSAAKAQVDSPYYDSDKYK
jgi:hypothetical protein